MVNFEDIIGIFSFNTYNRGLIRMDLDEATYLYKLIKKLKNPQCIEIGTYLGGSTILIAAGGGEVISIDNYSSKTFNNIKSDPRCDILKKLESYGLHKKVTLVKGNSITYNNNNMKCDILLIDGNHSYEGVKADYKHWIHTLKNGGHLIFHDSCATRKGATCRGEVKRFLEELNIKPYFQVGSLTHIKKGNINA